MIRIVYLCGYNSRKPLSTLGLRDFFLNYIFFSCDFNRVKHRVKMKSYSEMKVYPKNWETLKSTFKKIWEIQYTFINNKGIEYPRRIKGMSHIKNHSERVIETKNNGG